MKILKQLPIYPFIFAIVPVLSLVATNYREIRLSDSIRPLIASLLMAGLGLIIARQILRNWYKAGLVTFIALIFFFTYGHIYTLLHDFSIAGIAFFRHRTMLPLWVILFVIALYIVIKRIAHPEGFTLWLNLFCILLLVYPVITLTTDLLQQGEVNSSIKVEQGTVSIAASPNNPNIYYIILDGYGREDILDGLGYDNSAFIAELRARGFYVADCSQSNYAYTEFSLPSSLNYNYLNAINAVEHNARINLLKHGAVRTFLQEHGYQTVAFPTGFPWSEWTDADIYAGFNRSWSSLTEFERLALNTTMMKSFETAHASFLSDAGLRRENTLFTLKTLKTLPARNGNYFVFAHIVVPHGPYVFGPNGEMGKYVDAETKSDHLHGYLDQVAFINQEILKVIDTLIASSNTAPVIIIQGDHGPLEDISRGPSIKMPILNAYYLPGVNADKFLYPSISPVNTFRIVLNSYFGQNLPLLQDRSYFSPFDDRDAFTLVPNTCSKAPGN